MPTLNRTKSGVPSEEISDSTPLCPAPEPPRRIRSLHSGRSSSSCTTHTRAGSTPVSRTAAATASPERFMYVCGSTSHTLLTSECPASERHRFLVTPAPNRRASSRTHAKPRLCRVSAYSVSGLPRPTINVSSMGTSWNRRRRGKARGERRRPGHEFTRRSEPSRWQGHLRQSERRPGEPPHLSSLGAACVVPAQQVEQAMDAEQGQLTLRGIAITRRLPHHRLPGDGKVSHVIPCACERQYVGDRVLTRVLTM